MANQGRINFGIGFNIDKSGLNALKQSLSEIQGLTRKDLIDTSVTEKQLKSIQESALRVHQALNKSYNVKLNTYDIDAFKKAINSTEGSLSALQAKWKATGATGEKAFRNLADSLTSTNLNLKQTHNLLDSLGTTFMNTIKWSVASNAINTVTGSIQKAWGFTKELDKSLNDIMIVTDKSSESMERFARQANKAAKELGKSTTDYTKASLIYYQQGLDDSQVKARTETTLKAANVTGQSTSAVSEQLTAVWNGYKVQAAEAEMYVDKLAAVAATTAADLEELSTGMSKVASAANNMGVDIDQLNAQLATIISVTKQAPESVGTALKTVYARISDIEAGISDEATLGEYTAQMAEMGIKVLDSNNHLRDMGAVIEEIGGKWNTLNREQQISLAQTMAGTRQYNNLLALFENWDMYTQAMQTSATATGTLQQQQEEYMESLAAHFEKLSTAGERVYNAFFDADSAKDLIDVLTEAVELLGNFTEAIGGGGNMLLMLGTIATRVFNKQISQSIATSASNFINMKQNAESLQAALNNVRNISKMDNLDEATKSILELKDSLIVLRQQSLITDETFNQLTADIDKVKETANAASDLKAKFEGIDRRMSIDTTEAFKSGRRAGSTNASLASISKAASELMAEGLAGDDLIKANNEWAKYENSIKTLRQRATFTAEKQVAKGADGGKANDVNAIAHNAQKATQAMRDYADSIKNSSGLLAEHGVEQKNVIQAAQKLQQAQAELNRGVEAYQVALEGGNEKEIEKAKKKVLELRDAFNLVAKSAAVTGSATSRIANESADEVLVAAKSAAAGVVTETENASKQAAAAVQQQLSQIDLTKAIMQVTRIVTEISTLTTAISMLHNLGGIWENEDLTTGEKILQTVMNVSSAIGMLLPTITGFLAWQKKLAAEQTVNAIANIGLEKFKNELKKTSLSIEQQEVLLQAIKNGALTEEQIKQLKILGILKEQTKEQAKQAALEKVKSGFKDFGSGFKSGFTSGGGKGAFGTKGLSSTGTIGKILGAAAPYLLVAAAIAAVSISVYNHLDNINKKEQKAYSEAQARTKALQANLERVNSEYDTLESSLDNLASSTEAFEKLTEGTVEWEKALSDVNAQVVELLGKYPELYKFVETDEETGLMSISAEGQRLVKQQQLEELKAARAGAAAAQLQENEAAMAAKRDALAEKATGGTGDAGAIAGWGTAGLGAAGGVIGGVAAGAAAGSIVPVVGTIIGAAIGLGVGLLGSGIGVGIQEAQEEEYKANLDEQAIGEAYAQVGAAMFESEEALAKALGTTKDALTDEQKALLENKDAAIALAETVAKNTAQQKALLLQVGRGLVGEDATEGAVLRAGTEYKEAYSAELKKLQENAGWDTQDKKEALEYLAVLGLSEANFIGTKGTNRIQYLDANGDEQDISMNKVYAILAEDRAKKAADRIVAAIDKNFKAMNNALSGFSSDQKEILSTLGTAEFSLQKATKLDLEKFASLSETQLQAIATANGVTLDEVKTQLKEKLGTAKTAWDSPSNLEGEVLSKFLSAAKNVAGNLTLAQYTEYSQMFKQLFERFGDESVNTLYTILNQAGDESDELLTDILDTISWDSYDAKGQLYTLIDKYDLSDKVNLDLLDEYANNMLRLNGIYSMSSEKITEVVTAISDALDNLKPGTKLDEEVVKYIRENLGAEASKYLLESGGNTLWMGSASTLQGYLEKFNYAENVKTITGIDDAISDAKKAEGKVADVAKLYSAWQTKAKSDTDGGVIQSFDDVFKNLAFGENEDVIGWYLYAAIQSAQSRNTDDYVNLMKLDPTLSHSDHILQLTSSWAASKLVAENKGQTYHPTNENELWFTQETYKTIAAIWEEWQQNKLKDEYEPQIASLEAEAIALSGASDSAGVTERLKELEAEYVTKFTEGAKTLTTVTQLQDWLGEASKYRKLLGEEGYATIAEAISNQLLVLTQQSFSEFENVGALTAEALSAYVAEQTVGSTGEEKLRATEQILADLRLGTKQWDRAIEDLANNLASLERDFDNLTGVNAFNNISEQVDILNQQLTWTEEKLKDLKSFNIDTLQAAGMALNTSLSEVDFTLDISGIVDEAGEIDQAMYLRVLELAAEHGNDAIGLALQTYITSIEQYIQTQKDGEEEIYQRRKEYQDALCTQYEKWLETVTSGDEIKKQINALYREVGELTGDKTTVADALLGDFTVNQNLISDYSRAYNELAEQRAKGLTDQDYAEKLEALIAQHQEAILANAQAYLTASNQIVESLEEISALYDEQISYLEQLSALTETQANAYALIYGDINYARMAGYYERQLGYAMQISAASQAKYEQLKNEIFNEDGSYTEMFNQLSAEAQATLLQQFADAGQASADAFYSELEARQQVWTNEIEVALDRMTKNLFGDVDFSLMKEQWEWMRDQGDKYFDSIERGYEMTSLSLMFDKAIADTKDSKAQQAIAQLKKEQLEYMESIANLSEYDVTMAEKKLNLLQAEIALRDAEANKTQMRLMRGADGTYSYQYVADQNAVDEAREELNKMQSDIYEFSKQSAEDTVSEFYQGYEDILALIRNFYADGTISEQEQKIIDEREAAWLANAEKSEQITGEFRDIMSSSLSDFQGSLTGTSDTTINEISNSISGTIAQLSNGGFQSAFNEIINGAGGLKETSEKFMSEQEALFRQINQLLTGSDDGTGEGGLLSAIANIINEYNGEDGLIAAETAEYNLLKDKLAPQLEKLEKNYDNVGSSIQALISQYNALAAAKAAANGITIDDTDNTIKELPTNKELSLNPLPKGDTQAIIKEDGLGTSYTGLKPSTDPYNPKITNAKVLLRAYGSMYTSLNSAATPITQEGGLQVYRDPLDTTIYKAADGTSFVKVISSSDPTKTFYVQKDRLFGAGEGNLLGSAAFDTGGYTGAWGNSSGRLAMLHEKELVLNKVDTANILKAVDLVRSLESSMLNSMGQWQAGALASSAAWELAQDMIIEQNVHIDASFPNVSVKGEIEEAFNDLLNRATQYIYQKKK